MKRSCEEASRRELAHLGAGLAAAPALPVFAQRPAASAYIGPLTGVENGIEGRNLVAYTLDRYSAAPRRLRFQARSRGEADRWQKKLRTKLTELIGGFSRGRPSPASGDPRKTA